MYPPEDQCYLASEDEREEYVLRDKGRIWQSDPYNTGTPWNFGQVRNQGTAYLKKIKNKLNNLKFVIIVINSHV